MNKPFNDDPIDVLVKKYLEKNGTVLDPVSYTHLTLPTIYSV